MELPGKVNARNTSHGSIKTRNTYQFHSLCTSWKTGMEIGLLYRLYRSIAYLNNVYGAPFTLQVFENQIHVGSCFFLSYSPPIICFVHGASHFIHVIVHLGLLQVHCKSTVYESTYHCMNDFLWYQISYAYHTQNQLVSL